ncbi:hypothetical protein Tco_0104233 [Tanacetum coccineum]
MEKKDTLSSCSESEEQQMQLIQDKSKESCMVSFQRLHSHLKRLSNNDLKGSRTENGFGRAFATLFGQDFETFTGTMFLNMDQLQKQLDNNEFQEIGSMASFKVLETQFQMFINSQIYLNDEYIVMTRNYFLQYTQLDIPEFRETLVQFMEYVKKSIDERALHKMEYDSRVNERQIQTTEEKIDTSNALDALDASSVIIESNGTESQKQDTSSRLGNDADMRPVYDEEPMVEVQMTADDNVSATGQQHTEQPESNNEGEVDQNADQCYDTRPLPAKLTDNRTTKLLNQLLESKNVCLKKTVAQYSLKYRYIVQSYKGRTQSLVAEKTDISENRASRNFDLMINIMTFEHSSSSLGHQCQMMSDHNSSDLAPQRQEMSVENVSSGLVPQGQKASDYDNSDPVPPRQNVVPTAEKTDSSQQGLEFLFSPLLEEYYNPTHGQCSGRGIDFGRIICSSCSFVKQFGFRSPRSTQSFQSIRLTRKTNFLMSTEGRRLTCSAGKVRDPDHPEKVYHLRTSDPPVPKRYFYQSGQHFQTLIMPDALILEKALLEETVPFDKLCKLDVQRNKTALQVFSIGRVFGVICKLSQLMGLRTQLSDYGFNTNKIPLYSDSHSALAISSPRTTLHGQHTILGIPSKRNRLKMEIN